MGRRFIEVVIAFGQRLKDMASTQYLQGACGHSVSESHVAMIAARPVGLGVRR